MKLSDWTNLLDPTFQTYQREKICELKSLAENDATIILCNEKVEFENNLPEPENHETALKDTEIPTLEIKSASIISEDTLATIISKDVNQKKSSNLCLTQ